MDRRRVSLMGLMGAIAVLAVSFAAWRIPWLPLRTSAFFALVVFILLTATLGALLNRGASWVGFALFGWGWLVIAFLSLAIGSWTSTADRMPIPMQIVAMCLIERHCILLPSIPTRPHREERRHGILSSWHRAGAVRLDQSEFSQ
jgi:hypothetical protein